MASNVVVIDVDYYNVDKYKKLSPKKFVNEIDYKGFPKPSCICTSGRGIYFIYKLEDNVWLSSTSADAMLKKLKDKINNHFSDLGTDFSCMDNSRVVRLMGSNNYKDGKSKKSYIIEHSDKEYNIKELLRFFGDNDIPKRSPKKPKMPSFDKRTKNTKQVPAISFIPDVEGKWKKVSKTRVDDLLKLAEIRDYDFGVGTKNGGSTRNVFLHLLATYYFYCFNDPTEVFNFIDYINSKLTVPVKLREIQDIVESARKNNENRINSEDGDGFYKYSPDKIIELLSITRDEQVQLQKIHDEELRKKDKEEYNREYYKKKSEKSRKAKQEATEREIAWAAQLMAEGMTIKQMMEEMGYKETKIKALRKKAKELQQNPVSEDKNQIYSFADALAVNQ